MNGIMMTPTTGTFLCARPIEQPTIGLDNAELVIHSAKGNDLRTMNGQSWIINVHVI
jgi:hypothetical protein